MDRIHLSGEQPIFLENIDKRAQMLGPTHFSVVGGIRGGCKDGNDNLSVRRRVEWKAGSGLRNMFLGVPSVGKLVEFKRAALRRGLWFRVLDRAERGVVDLTVKYVGNIRSAKLAGVVVAILDKLKVAMESAVEKMVRVFGRSQARKVSGLAVGWGNLSASRWAEDVGFAWYLAMLQMNTGRLFRV